MPRAFFGKQMPWASKLRQYRIIPSEDGTLNITFSHHLKYAKTEQIPHFYQSAEEEPVAVAKRAVFHSISGMMTQYDNLRQAHGKIEGLMAGLPAVRSDPESRAQVLSELQASIQLLPGSPTQFDKRRMQRAIAGYYDDPAHKAEKITAEFRGKKEELAGLAAKARERKLNPGEQARWWEVVNYLATKRDEKAAGLADRWRKLFTLKEMRGKGHEHLPALVRKFTADIETKKVELVALRAREQASLQSGKPVAKSVLKTIAIRENQIADLQDKRILAKLSSRRVKGALELVGKTNNWKAAQNALDVAQDGVKGRLAVMEQRMIPRLGAKGEHLSKWFEAIGTCSSIEANLRAMAEGLKGEMDPSDSRKLFNEIRDRVIRPHFDRIGTQGATGELEEVIEARSELRKAGEQLKPRGGASPNPIVAKRHLLEAAQRMNEAKNRLYNPAALLLRTHKPALD